MKTERTKFYKLARALIIISAFVAVLSAVSYISFRDIKPVEAHHLCCCNEATCCAPVTGCAIGGCKCQSDYEKPITIKHITDEFIQHREWIIKIFWEAHILPAMLLMTEQISTMAMDQMLIVGTLFDAKHQLETQRLLQEMQAQAHKDYHPSEGMCKFGTNTRSLAASDRNADLSQLALAARGIQRQLLSGDGISAGGPRDDSGSRLDQFKKTYCNPADFGNGLKLLCSGSTPERYNKDVNFTHTVDNIQTLKIDFAKDDVPPDEEDVLALSANLYGHKVMPFIHEDKMATKDGTVIDKGAIAYMKTRSLAAQRSVAQAAYAAQVAMKAEGEAEVLPYMEAILKEMGIEEKDVKAMLGERPSYYAQMELLTKKLYQTPNFYVELYDKPANIDRKNTAMMAINLMQRRDMYRSQLRSEAISAVWLETALEELEELYVNESNPFTENTPILNIGGLN